jgi:hypothetical protein
VFVLKPIAFLLTTLPAGGLLAVASLGVNAPTGWIGAAALVAWAFIARRRWLRVEATSGLEPSAPERILWLRFAGNSLILGHLVVALILVQGDLRLGNGNSLAVDSWTLVLGQFVAALAFHRDRNEHDERHDAIHARGVRAGYAALIVGLIVVILWLAFMPPPLRSALTDFVLANALIILLLDYYGVMLLVQLIAYARDAPQALATDDAFS